MSEENCGFCPNCGSSMQGDPIDPESLRKGWYGDWDGVTPRYFSRIIGVNVPGIYDGTLFWTCPDCGFAWHRFPENSILGFKAQPIILSVNSKFSKEVS